MSSAATHHLAAAATTHSLHDVHALLDALWHDAPHTAAGDRTRFTVITAELVANIIEHGHTGGDHPPHFDLTIEVRGHEIHGYLTDDGREPPRGAPGGRRLDPPASPHREPTGAAITDNEIDALRESGRGLLVIRSTADDLALTRTSGHNRWHYVVRPRPTGHHR